jgi:hypothetical protein
MSRARLWLVLFSLGTVLSLGPALARRATFTSLQQACTTLSRRVLPVLSFLRLLLYFSPPLVRSLPSRERSHTLSPILKFPFHRHRANYFSMGLRARVCGARSVPGSVWDTPLCPLSLPRPHSWPTELRFTFKLGPQKQLLVTPPLQSYSPSTLRPQKNYNDS